MQNNLLLHFSLSFAQACYSKGINIFTSEVLFLLLHNMGKALGKTLGKSSGNKDFSSTSGTWGLSWAALINEAELQRMDRLRGSKENTGNLSWFPINTGVFGSGLASAMELSQEWSQEFILIFIFPSENVKPKGTVRKAPQQPQCEGKKRQPHNLAWQTSPGAPYTELPVLASFPSTLFIRGESSTSLL